MRFFFFVIGFVHNLCFILILKHCVQVLSNVYNSFLVFIFLLIIWFLCQKVFFLLSILFFLVFGWFFFLVNFHLNFFFFLCEEWGMVYVRCACVWMHVNVSGCGYFANFLKFTIFIILLFIFIIWFLVNALLNLW